MTLASEAGSVQYPLIRYAAQIGWMRLTRQEALDMRGGEAGILLTDAFVDQLQRLNPNVVDRDRAEELARRITRTLPTIQGNLDVWEHLRGIKTVFVPEDNRERNVRFLDLDNPEANMLHVTDEWSYQARPDADTIRFDVTFCINGIPLLVIEAKAGHLRDGMSQAVEQLRRYHEQGPETLAVLQLFGVTHLHKFLYGATWNTSQKAIYNWRQEAEGDYEHLIKAFLDPKRVLRVLSDFIVFSQVDGELSKFVLRPHQMRAANRILERAVDNEKHRGLVWHTQGSGKTYTMITAAKMLIDEPELSNPTVLVLVDRIELEAQMSTNFEALGFRDVRVANSKEHLNTLLASDWRGVILSMIHKFEGIPSDICPRENVFVLLDEAHRSTAGALGTYMMAALPNATYVGFTGTPIDRTAQGRGTFKTFGSEDESGFLDKYSILESVQDGTTVPLNYKLASNDLLVDRVTLEQEFLQVAELEGVSDIETLNKVLERAVTLRTMMKNRGRIDGIAKAVANHYRENVEPMGYKAFLVGVDREACSLYKDALDRHLPPEYSAVIISHGHNDPAALRRFHYDETKELTLRKAFRKPGGAPKILIVTEKLLTGFDAPVLYCMYLDKPMRDHVLLQAIARVNRPYEDTEGRVKPAGFILDFVGIFEKLAEALAFDSKDVSGVVTGLVELQRRFAELMAIGRKEYLGIGNGLYADKQVEAIIDHFRGEESWARLQEYISELENLYEILSPDVFLRAYLDDYDRLMRIYATVRAGLFPGADLDRSFLRKTAELVLQDTSSSPISWTGQIHELTPVTLDQLMASDNADTVKVVNLVKLLTDQVAKERDAKPYLVSIGEKADKLAAAFRDRQISTQDALAQAETACRQVLEAEKAQAETGLDQNAFAVLFYLKGKNLGESADRVAAEAGSAFAECPQWRLRSDQERQIRVKLHAALIREGRKDESTEYVDEILESLRRVRA